MLFKQQPYIKDNFSQILPSDSDKVVSLNPETQEIAIARPKSKESIQRTNKNIDVAQKLSNLNLAPTYKGKLENSNQYGYVQNYGGKDLYTLGQEGKVSPKQAYKLGSQLARQRTRMYNQEGIIHSDLHGGNIVINNPNKKNLVGKIIDYDSVTTVPNWIRKLNLPVNVSKNLAEGRVFDSLGSTYTDVGLGNKGEGFKDLTKNLSNIFRTGFNARRTFSYMTNLARFN